MHTIGVLLLAAATAGDGFGYGSPGVGLKKLFRPHVVASGPPSGGPIGPTGWPGGGPAEAPAAAASPTPRARSISSIPTG